MLRPSSNSLCLVKGCQDSKTLDHTLDTGRCPKQGAMWTKASPYAHQDLRSVFQRGASSEVSGRCQYPCLPSCPRSQTDQWTVAVPAPSNYLQQQSALLKLPLCCKLYMCTLQPKLLDKCIASLLCSGHVRCNGTPAMQLSNCIHMVKQ